MRVALIAAVVVASGGIAFTASPSVRDFYHQLYPESAVQRRALDECFMANGRFDRLDPAEREACYRYHRAAATAMPGHNAVELRQSAALGRLPQNDVRTVQQNAGYLHALGASGR